MSLNDLKFEMLHHNLSYDKRILIGKMFKGKFLKDPPEATDYAILKGLKTTKSPDSKVTASYWIANTYAIYDGPTDMIYYGPDYYIQETNSYGEIPTSKMIGTKPVIKYSIIKELSKIIARYTHLTTFIDEEYYIIEFGEYPQKIVDDNLEKKLNDLYRKKILSETGLSYDYDIGDPEKGMHCITEDEYEYNGNKYVRVKNLNPEGILSNGKKAGDKEYYWVKVEPVLWVVDKGNDLAITDKIIIGGVAYNKKETYSFEGTYLEKFIEYHFKKDLLQKIKNINSKNDKSEQTNNAKKVKVRKRTQPNKRQ